jgi:mRNA interferase MazF
MDYHVRIDLEQTLPTPFASRTMWAKCDMISTVSLTRLDRFKLRKSGSDVRTWISGQLDWNQIKQIKVGMLFGLGLGSLTLHL